MACIYVDSQVDAKQLKDTVSELLTVEPAQVYVGSAAGLESHQGRPSPVALIQPSRQLSDNAFGCLLETVHDGALTPIDVATRLCRAVGTRALIDDGGLATQVWLLICPDGWHGRVVVEEAAMDCGHLVISHALQPIPTAPDIPVQPPPPWQSGWYEDNQIPEAGYTTTGPAVNPLTPHHSGKN